MIASTLADRVRRDVVPTLDLQRRSELGQYMTPAPISRFMSGLFGPVPARVRVLDAGAGVGALTAALVHEFCGRERRPSEVEVTAFEVDPTLVPQLRKTIASCAEECRVAGIAFSARVVTDDFVLHAAEPLLGSPSDRTHYDCAILNPPYAKINLGSKWRQALSSLGIETSNLYAAFIAVALQQLRPGGQLVAITPRSFCNGLYFEPFRRELLATSRIERLHVYESRRKAFQNDDVLQENIIFKLVKGEEQTATLVVSSSFGPEDEAIVVRSVPFDEVVLPTDKHHYIRIATSQEADLAQRVRAFPATLKELGISVSTGRVVEFRAKEHLRGSAGADTIPLVYPAHFERGFVLWPRLDGRKPNALAYNSATVDLAVPAGIYVLTKRFTSKEERRRLVAVVYDPERVPGTHVGFENHLNYFHDGGHGLPGALARGLALFLNSTAVDQFFRQFSGHTQVNATDLRNLHYPSRNDLERIGTSITDWPDQERIDDLIKPLL